MEHIPRPPYGQAMYTVAYLELLKYLGTCTLRYKSGYTAIDLSYLGAVIVAKSYSLPNY